MVATKEECTEEEVQVADILCNLKKVLRARERRRRMRRLLPATPEIPSWGMRRPQSMPEENPVPAPAPISSGVAERDGAASPDTLLAYPESGGDDVPAAAEEEDAKNPTSQEQWVHEQQGVVASLSPENESLKQLHKVKREQEEPEQARKRPRVEAQAPLAADPRAAAAAAAALGLDLNEPARGPDEDEQARSQQAQAAEWYRRAQLLQAAMRKAAVSAGARRRRLEILRAKVACPLVSSRQRRVG